MVMDAATDALVASAWHEIWHDVPVTGFLIDKDGSSASADSHSVQQLRMRWAPGRR